MAEVDSLGANGMWTCDKRDDAFTEFGHGIRAN